MKDFHSDDCAPVTQLMHFKRQEVPRVKLVGKVRPLRVYLENENRKGGGNQIEPGWWKIRDGDLPPIEHCALGGRTPAKERGRDRAFAIWEAGLMSKRSLTGDKHQTTPSWRSGILGGSKTHGRRNPRKGGVRHPIRQHGSEKYGPNADISCWCVSYEV